MKFINITLVFFTALMSAVTFANPMTEAQFVTDANASVNSGRCVGDPISAAECKGELDYALSENLITQKAYDWGVTNGFYPVINRRNEVRAICKCGCFEADMNISTFSMISGSIETVAAKDVSEEHQLVALNAESMIDAMSTDAFDIRTITAGEEAKALYVFNMENGKALKVTQFHGMLLADGLMVAAKDVQAGDSFIDAASNTAVEVVSIDREFTDEDVYNFETDSDANASHIIVAEGFFVGDLIWQNQLSSELGELLIRQ